VVTHLFVAGEELTSGSSRVTTVMQRVLAMTDSQVTALLTDTLARFGNRHPNLSEDLLGHFDQIGYRLGRHQLSLERRLLLGAYATNEFSVEAAALCNPSIVAHPDQSGVETDELRVILSLRAVGEGHISSIEFRTGIVGPEGQFVLDDPGPMLVAGRPCDSTYGRADFALLAERAGVGNEILAMVLDGLPEMFGGAELERSIASFHFQVPNRQEVRDTVERLRAVVRSNYTITFPSDSHLGQRVIRPNGPTESHGIEDARFLRFVDDDGSVTYYATYTAFDGSHVAPQLLHTDDFRTFQVSQLSGRAATNKGMALFPRRIDGRYVALSRWDRESNAITTSLDTQAWDDPVELQSPEQPWELIQVGNCGSPIETVEGWLVFTHGVGPMRTYSLGAMLLDLDDPTRVLGKLTAPLLSPNPAERDGYVPNVVYTCGALLHRGTVVLPYAFGDRETTLGLIPVAQLLDLLLASPQ
jgi:predicted GH43/DUF377 family glycosyl hydrolase